MISDQDAAFSTQARLELQLTDRLNEQAGRVEASDDLVDGVYRRHGVLRIRRTMSRVAVSVASLALAGLAVGALGRATPTDITESATPSESESTDGRCTGDNVDSLVWLKRQIPAQTVEELTTMIANDPRVLTYHYVDEAETYHKFNVYYRDEPEVLELVTADQLPTSFEVVFHHRDGANGFAVELEAHPGVEDIEFVDADELCD